MKIREKGCGKTGLQCTDGGIVSLSNHGRSSKIKNRLALSHSCYTVVSIFGTVEFRVSK